MSHNIMTEREFDMVESPRSEYEAQVRATLGEVFYHFLEQDLKNLPDQPSQKRLSDQKRPVFIDALKRGQVQIMQQLTSSGLSIEIPGLLAVKRYQFVGDKLHWQIVPKSEDPFQKMDFSSRLDSAGINTEGQTYPWLEVDIVQQMLNEGLKEQDSKFDQFQHASRMISDVSEYAGNTLPFLNSYVESFEEFVKAYRLIGPRQGILSDLKQNFLEKMLFKNHPILEKVPQIIEVCRQILSLDAIFSKGDRPLEHPDTKGLNHTKRRRALAVELLTNPEGFDGDEGFTIKPTTTERLMRVWRAVTSLEERSEPEDLIIGRYIIVMNTLENAKKQLIPLLNKQGVGVDLAQEFIQNLLSQFLKDLPGKKYLGEKQEKPEIRPEINEVYLLEDPVILPSPPKREGRNYTLQNPRSFVDEVMSAGRFSTFVFARFSKEEQEQAFKDILSRSSERSLDQYEKNVDLILKAFRLRFQAAGNKVTIRTPYPAVRDKPLPLWALSARTIFFETCLDRLQQNDQKLVEVFHRLAVRTAVHGFTRKTVRTSSAQDLYDKISLTGMDRTKALNQAINHAAAYVLLISSEGYRPGQNSADQAIGHILQTAINIAEGIRKNLPYQLEEFDIQNLHQLVKERVDEYSSLIEHQYFPPDYQNNKAGYFVRMIDQILSEQES